MRTAHTVEEVWDRLESETGVTVPVPYWAVAWPGGQALARWVLDHPEAVRGRTVIDVGSGCGIVAIAAAMAGARQVRASDIDSAACHAALTNAELNAVKVDVRAQDPIGNESGWDVWLAGDLWYERFLARSVTGFLRAECASGGAAYLGDAGRAYFPRGSAELLASYSLASPLLAAGLETVSAWRLKPAPRFLHT